MFTRDDYLARVEAMRAKLVAGGYDLFVAATTDTIFYFSGAIYVPLERPVLLIIAASGAPRLVAPVLERAHIRDQIPWAELFLYHEYPAPAGQRWQDTLEAACDDARRIAVEPYARVEITSALGDRIAVEPFAEELRLIKSPAELRLIQRAAHYSDRQIARMREVITTGTTVADVYAATAHIGAEMADEIGADYSPLINSYWSVPWTAPENAEPHRIPQLADTFRAEGPHNLTAIARYAGYSAESERLFTLGPLAPDIADAARAVIDARKLAWSMLRPGQPTSEIDMAVRALFAQRGFSDYVRHRTGHGFGLGGHEGPWIAEGADDVLAANMVISVEPGLYFPGVGGIRDSDTLLITDDGHELMTHEPYLEDF